MGDDKELYNQYTDLVLSAAGSLVGFAMGGPLGSLVGGASAPAIKLAYGIVNRWFERRKARVTEALNHSFFQANLDNDTVLQKLAADDSLSDDVIRLLRQLIDTDPELDCLFASIITSMINDSDIDDRKRLIVLSESIRGLNSVQLQIIRLISLHDNHLSAEEIALEVGVPEIELRNAVRDLELRGVITDNNTEPTIWELRELGMAISKLIIEVGNNND